MKKYSFQNTKLMISRGSENPLLMGGWAPGDDVIRIKRRSPSMIDAVGASGEMMLSCCADRSGEMTFRLHQDSPSNVDLHKMLQKQESGDEPFVPLAVSLTDGSVGGKVSTSGCYIKGLPELIWGVKANSYEWTLVAERVDVFPGDQS